MRTYESSNRVKCPFCARLDKCYDPMGHDHTCGLCHMTFDVKKLGPTNSPPGLRIAIQIAA